MTRFEKSSSVFPVKDEYIYLNNCGVAPLYSGAEEAAQKFMKLHSRKGIAVFFEFGNILGEVHDALALLMKTNPDNFSFMKNTAEGLSIIANGYPFEEGDEIISYIHEYPSNHYPWYLQKHRGVKLKLLPDSDPTGNLPVPEGQPRGWSLKDLEELVTDRTRILAVSHVQFTSGFAVDLKILGDFCKERGIDLVIDAAQSLGCLPVYPEEYNISAVAASGWKWMLGPVGSGILYTSPEFRKKIRVTMAGAEVVTQGTDYLNHTWQPHDTGRLFEYSTTQVSYALGLERSLKDLFLTHTPEEIRAEVFRLQDLFLKHLDQDKWKPALYPDQHRSGILGLVPPRDPGALSRALLRKGVFVTERGGFMRIAPHFYIDEDEILKAANVLNEI